MSHAPDVGPAGGNPLPPFLGPEAAEFTLEAAGALIFPVPYEATTSWGGGTGRGPARILEASGYIELHDQEIGTDPSQVGIHTLPPPELDDADPAAAMEELEKAYRRMLQSAGERFPVMLGGEHAISAPAIRAQAEWLDTRIHVLQLDAHADLRDEYGGTPHSHASVMARVLDVAEVVGVGIRGISPEEVETARRQDGVTHIYAERMQDSPAWMARALEALGDPVYITFDVDYLDPSIVPATGTPEPGGGEWYPTLRFLRRVFRERTVVGCDVVELAPIAGMRAADFTVAKLVYKLLGYRFERGRG